MTVAEMVILKREEILAVAAKYGASNVRLFGSVARSESDEESDIDLLVDLARAAHSSTSVEWWRN